MSTYLLLHAFPFDSSMWDEVATRLKANGHAVVVPDLRGFGSAPLGDHEPDLELMVDGALGALGGEPAVIAGCSMGGYVALGIARRRPDAVQALVLVDTKATADGEGARAHRERVASLAESGGDWAAGMIDGLLGETTRATRPGVVSRVEEVLAAAPRPSVAWAQRAMAGRRDAVDTLCGLHVPVLVVMGEQDTMSPMPEQARILEACRDARLVTIPDCGHLSPLESPEAVAAALMSADLE
jgi:pimeloyl-ACP methyl ester carboxylesterase